MKNKSLAASLLAIALLNPASNAFAQSFNSVFAFGDSLSDAGNSPSAVLSIYNLLGGACDSGHPCPPYSNGHFTNGSTAVEYLANSILPGGANAGNFHDYAVAGATTGLGNFGDGGSNSTLGSKFAPGMSLEIANFFATPSPIDPNSLFFIWGGANDFLTFSSPITAAQNIASYIQTLSLAGAKNFFIPNLPNLGLTPFAISSSLQNPAQAFTLAFNSALSQDLAQLVTQLPLANIMQFDTFNFFNNLYANPNQYGFTDVLNPCISTSSVCANPDQNIYWDDFHPTTAAQAVLAGAFAQAIPEPATVVLLILGLVGLSKKSWRISKRLTA